jgi:hypothetical protein
MRHQSSMHRCTRVYVEIDLCLITARYDKFEVRLIQKSDWFIVCDALPQNRNLHGPLHKYIELGSRSCPRHLQTLQSCRWPHTPSTVEVKERIELYLHSLSGFLFPVLGWILLHCFVGGVYLFIFLAEITYEIMGASHGFVFVLISWIWIIASASTRPDDRPRYPWHFWGYLVL